MKAVPTLKFSVLYILVVDQIEAICLAELLNYFIVMIYFQIGVALVMT